MLLYPTFSRFVPLIPLYRAFYRLLRFTPLFPAYCALLRFLLLTTFYAAFPSLSKFIFLTTLYLALFRLPRFSALCFAYRFLPRFFSLIVLYSLSPIYNVLYCFFLLTAFCWAFCRFTALYPNAKLICFILLYAYPFVFSAPFVKLPYNFCLVIFFLYLSLRVFTTQIFSHTASTFANLYASLCDALPSPGVNPLEGSPKR
jgi:hypothetical protein